MPILGILASQISGHLWAPSGAYDSLATVNVGTAVSSVTFSGIPSGYKHIEIRSNFAMSASGILKLTFNGDTSANYKGHFLAGDGSTAYASGSPSSAPNAICIAYFGGANSFGAGVATILDYANTNKYKVSRSLSGCDRNGAGDIEFDSGLWMNTAAITSITLTGQNGNLNANSSFALYGVK